MHKHELLETDAFIPASLFANASDIAFVSLGYTSHVDADAISV